MQYSIVNFSNVEKATFRLDAEYYKPSYLQEDQQRHKFENILLDRVAFITDGQHGYHEVDENSPVVMLTAKNAKNWFTDTVGAEHVAQWVDEKNKRSSLKLNDLILSTRGSVGYCAIVTPDVLPANIDQDIARIALSDSSSIQPQFLLVYLNCKFGNDWIIRNASGMVQQGIPLDKVRLIPVPLLSNTFQQIITNTVIVARQKIDDSLSLYNQAEEHLLDELGLHSWQPENVLSFTSQYSKTEQAGRLDAEYFQPKYQVSMSKLEKSKKKIADIVSLEKRKFSPNPNQYFNYIEISNVDKDGHAESDAVLGDHAPSRAQWIVKNGDIITSTVRPIRSLSALIEPHQDGFVCSSGFAVLRTKNIAPEMLLVYLKLPVVCEILDLHTTASMYPAISISDLLSIPISLPDDESIQKEVVGYVKQSRISRLTAKQLLEIAKHAVEIAIEQNEAIAKAWLIDESSKLGVNIN